MAKTGYCQFSSLGRDRDFSVVIELFGSVSRHDTLCRDMVPRLKGWLGRDRVFPSLNRVVSSWFYVATRALSVSRQCFVLCRDDVAIEGPSSRTIRRR